MLDELFDQMYRVESRHWWFRARRRIILDILRSRLAGASSAKVCDVGCGCGMMLSDLAAHGYDAVGLDSTPKAVEYCRLRGVSVVQGSLPDGLGEMRGPFDAVLMLDVLEHIDSQRFALESSLRMLSPGGILILTVPAYQWLWSAHDERHGHLRRYSAKDLRHLFAELPGARVELLSFMNFWLFPLALVSRTFARIFRSRKPVAELSVPPRPINALLEGAFASERIFLRRGLSMPFGLSLVAVLRVPETPSPQGSRS